MKLRCRLRAEASAQRGMSYVLLVHADWDSFISMTSHAPKQSVHCTDQRKETFYALPSIAPILSVLTSGTYKIITGSSYLLSALGVSVLTSWKTGRMRFRGPVSGGCCCCCCCRCWLLGGRGSGEKEALK